MHSCIYDGTVAHRRHHPREHSFRYRVWMAYLDLSELGHVFDAHPLWSTSRAAPAWWRRADYLGDPDQPLDQAVRELIEERTGSRPGGPIRMLTNLRMFGHCFNPVTFYYVFDAAGEEVVYLVAEVTNTPWGERHAYVAEGLQSTQAKALHVSPFMDMDGHYRWQANLPADHLSVSLSLHQREGRTFDAMLNLTRREITRAELTHRLLGQLPSTAKVTAGIYSQALRLRLKGLRIKPRPTAETTQSPGGCRATNAPRFDSSAGRSDQREPVSASATVSKRSPATYMKV